MAFSIKTQSQIAKEWQNFIDDANRYFKKIKEIANKDEITNKDEKRIKIMLEIILDEYKLLKPSPLLPKYLKEKAKEKYLKAKEIYERVFNKTSE